MTREQQLDAVRGLGRCPSWWRFVARSRWLSRFAAIMAFDTSRMAEVLRSVYGADTVEELANRPTAVFASLVRGQR